MAAEGRAEIGFFFPRPTTRARGSRFPQCQIAVGGAWPASRSPRGEMIVFKSIECGPRAV